MHRTRHRNQILEKDQTNTGGCAVTKRLLSIPDPPGTLARATGETLSGAMCPAASRF